MADRHSLILDENINLKKALSSTKAALERTTDDYKTLKLLYEDLKNHNITLERENKDLFLKIEQISQEKKEIELQFDTTIRNLKNSIEQKQKEIEEVQTKIIPILDQDMIKIKLINELEVPHKLQMEAKNFENDKLQDENYEIKRQIELTLAKNDVLKSEKEKEIKQLQIRHRNEISELTSQISDLTDRLDDNKDKEIIRSLKKDNDEFKQRLNHKDQEIDEVYNELNRAKEEKQQLFIKLSSKLDQEKDEKLQAISSRDKLQKRVFLLEEDIKKFQEKLSQKILLSERLEKDLNELRLQISIKEENIKGLYKKIDERFEENLELSQKHKEDLAKLTSDYEEIKRNTENEKNKIIDKLLLEIESLNETKSKNLREIDNNKRNILALNEELRDTKEHNSDLIRRIERLEFETQDKENEKNRIQMNLKSLKKTIRDEEKPVKDFEIIDEKEEKITNKNKDQNIEKFSHIKEENSNLRKKIRKYNEKLAQANKKILELLQEKAGFIEKLKTTSEKDEYLNNYKEDLPFMTKEKPNKLMNQTFDKRLNYKDELLLDEINRNINKGMQFYKL